MRRFREVKNEILNFLEIYNQKHGSKLCVKITPIDNDLKISIYEQLPSHHLFNSNPPLKTKVISKDELLRLNNLEIHKKIINIIENDEEVPFYGPRATP